MTMGKVRRKKCKFHITAPNSANTLDTGEDNGEMETVSLYDRLLLHVRFSFELCGSVDIKLVISVLGTIDMMLLHSFQVLIFFLFATTPRIFVWLKSEGLAPSRASAATQCYGEGGQ